MQIPLSGRNAVVGRAFVVHELEDDLGKGKYLACNSSSCFSRKLPSKVAEGRVRCSCYLLLSFIFLIFLFGHASAGGHELSLTTGNAGGRLACGMYTCTFIYMLICFQNRLEIHYIFQTHLWFPSLASVF